MAVSFGILKVLRFKMCALLGVRDLGAFGGCIIIRTVTCDVLQYFYFWWVISSYLHSSLINVFQVTVSLLAMLLVMMFFGRMMFPLDKNAFHCCNRYGIPSMEINEVSSAFITRSVKLTVGIDLGHRVNLLLELIFIRDRTFAVSPAGLISSEVMELINYLCTNWYVIFAKLALFVVFYIYVRYWIHTCIGSFYIEYYSLLSHSLISFLSSSLEFWCSLFSR